jgi:GNAT superfamily N-acetyltransferase
MKPAYLIDNDELGYINLGIIEEGDLFEIDEAVGHLMLSTIYVLTHQRGKRKGSELLCYAINYADLEQKDLWIVPFAPADSQFNETQLIEWYQRYGFKQSTHNKFLYKRSPGATITPRDTTTRA